MSYVTKYQCPFATRIKGVEITGDIYIKGLDYSGGTTQLQLASKGLELINDWGGWFDPFVRQKVVFWFINDAADFFEYIDLFTSEEKEFFVQIDIANDSENITIFEGWLEVGTVGQKYINKSEVALTATNYVSKLQYHFNDAIDTLQEISLIDLIIHALIGTGKEDPIRVNAHMLPEGHEYEPSDIFSPFNRAGLYTEVFWKNNVERYSSLEVLEAILKAFDCMLYWWDGYWWIERYRDMYASTCYYYQYSINESATYGYGSGVSPHAVTKLIEDLQDFDFQDTSQTMNMIPGYKRLEVFLNLKGFLNLVLNDFSEATNVYTDPDPGKREWECYVISESTCEIEYPTAYFGISNAYFLNCLGRNNTAAGFIGVETTDEEELYPWRGITTKFSITDNALDTQLSLSWKSVVSDYFWTRSADPAPPAMSICDMRVWWYLKIVGTNKYLQKNESSGDYEVVSGNVEDCCNVIEYSCDSLWDEDRGVMIIENSVLIAISDIASSDLVGDIHFEFCIGLPIVKYFDAYDTFLHPTIAFHSYREWVGDVLITVTSTPQDNLIKGELDNNVLEAKRVETDVFDSQDLNYKNALLTGTDYAERVSGWFEGHDESSASDVYELHDWLLLAKFQLYNRNRKKVEGRVRCTRFLRPFELFFDSADSNRKYVLLATSYYPTKAEYEVILFEYDNTTDINFV